jgi:hypothetical protein
VAVVAAPLLRDAPSGVAHDKDLILAVAHTATDLWRVRKLGGGSAVAHGSKGEEKSQVVAVAGQSGALISLWWFTLSRVSSERAEASLVQYSFYKGSHVHAFRVHLEPVSGKDLYTVSSSLVLSTVRLVRYPFNFIHDVLLWVFYTHTSAVQ